MHKDSMGIRVCTCLRPLSAMQSLLLRHSGFPLGMWGFVWIVGLVSFLLFSLG